MLRSLRFGGTSLERGDVFEIRAPRRTRGHEQRGTRYGVIVQANEFLALSTVVVAPTSRSAAPSIFRPRVHLLDAETFVLVDQLAALDLGRLGARVGRVSHTELEAVDLALGGFLGIFRRR